MTNVLLQGDWTQYPMFETSTGDILSRFGFGNVRWHWPSFADLTAPWAWETRSFFVESGKTYVWPLTANLLPTPYGTKQFKWAVTSLPTNLDNVEMDYTLQIYDTCPLPGGGASAELLYQDLSFDIRKRIQLSASDVCPQGHAHCRCLEMRAQVWTAPTTGTYLFSAAYSHSGPTDVH